MRPTRVVCAVFAIALICSPVAAQERVVVLGSELDGYARLVELTDGTADAPLLYRSASSLRHLSAGSPHPWMARYQFNGAPPASSHLKLRWLGPQTTLVFNSTYAKGDNDGALWAGRGFSGLINAGAEVRLGPVTATLYPSVLYEQNRSFPLAAVTSPNRSSFAYPWDPSIDFPQRFGSEAIRSVDWGQSGVRLDVGRFTTGFTTENLWWGPGFRNAIIMSNAGPGFPHLDVGTGRPVRLRGAGTLEVRLIAGALAESGYFDFDPTNKWRFLNGLTVGFAPRFLRGLTVGVTRILYERWRDGHNPLLVLAPGLFNQGTIDSTGTVVNDSTDQLISLVARWTFPASGFGVHLEWARNDFSGSLRDFLLEPDASDAITIGVEQALATDGPATWRIRAEATRVGPSAISVFRGTGPYYVHQVGQGYTNRGQLLGAVVGPGGSSQFLGIDYFSDTGRWGVFVQRARFADETYISRFTGQSFQYMYHDVELTLGLSALRFLGPVDLTVTTELTRRLNRYFVLNDDITNLKVDTQLRWVR